MTLHLPLNSVDKDEALHPTYISHSIRPEWDLLAVLKTVRRAQRIIVVCGAGISVAAGIPDFRSFDGVFQKMGGKDSFDAVAAFQSADSRAKHFRMIAELHKQCNAAQPTAFHKTLADLHERGKLLRVYTQNIDALEARAGIPMGIPAIESQKKAAVSKGEVCVPLHGTIHNLSCISCSTLFPTEAFVEPLERGAPISCPHCIETQTRRQLAGFRPRCVGQLRASVVLYSEDHAEAEALGECIRHDVESAKRAFRKGADLLLVAGSSLEVRGARKLVRDLSNALRQGTPKATRVLVNLSAPKQCEGLFDVWIQGDAEEFAQRLNDVHSE